jgi:hypothetical protein
MKLFEKVIIILTVAAGCVGIILVLTFALVPAGRTEDRALTPIRAPAEKEALVIYVSGDVFLNRDARWRPLEIGELVTAGDFVKTFEHSFCDIQFGERTIVSVRPDTSFRIDEALHAGGAVKSVGRLAYGSLQYKVERLTGSDRVRVIAGSKAFGVRGTEFLVERRGEAILCGVKSGRVEVFPDGKDQPEGVIEAGREAEVDGRTGALGATSALSQERRELLDRLAGLAFIGLGPGAGERLVKLAVRVEPASAEILLDGKPAGIGSYAGVFPAGTPLNFILRKAGYLEKTFTITPKAGDNRPYFFKLDLDEPEKGAALPGPDARFELRVKKIEDELRRAATENEALVKDRDGLKQDLEAGKKENARLAAELEDARRKMREAADKLK